LGLNGATMRLRSHEPGVKNSGGKGLPQSGGVFVNPWLSQKQARFAEEQFLL